MCHNQSHSSAHNALVDSRHVCTNLNRGVNESAENALVSGVSINGPGCSWSWVHPTVFHPELNGSIGVCLDSTESHTRSGSCYQNRVDNVIIAGEHGHDWSRSKHVHDS